MILLLLHFPHLLPSSPLFCQQLFLPDASPWMPAVVLHYYTFQGTEFFIIGDWNAKVGGQEIRGITGKFGLGVQNEAGQRPIEFCQENALIIANILFQQHRRRLYTWTSPDGQHRNQSGYVFAAKDGEALYSQQKQDKSWLWLRS